MSRRVDGWPDLGRVLAAALAAEAPAWVRPETRERAADLLAALRADVAEVLAAQSQRVAARTLGVSLSTLVGWIGAEGWARIERGRTVRRMDLASTPTADLLALRSVPTTRADALAELRRRLEPLGPQCDSPAALAAASGIAERTLRRVLGELDAGGPVPVGWVRARGGGGGAAREARAKNRRAKTAGE